MKKIKVLVVDDSIVFREFLRRGLSADSAIEVVATAADPFDARDKILKYAPDVITCDVEMPKMNGIEFLRRLLPQYPIPAIIISAVSDAVFEAMQVGAVDFVTKPDSRSPSGVETFISELIVKVKTAAVARPGKSIVLSNADKAATVVSQSDKILAIGASTGGTEAIHSVLSRLPTNIAGIVIVQHIPPVFSRMFAERLNLETGFRVKEAQTGDKLQRGVVLVAPGDRHMRIKKIGGQLSVECFQGDKVNGHCPSVDVLFDSVAKEIGAKSVGVILTGMGYDGAKGLLAMRKSGAKTIGQNEQTCVVYGMPKVAYNIGAVEKLVSLQNIPQTICKMLER
jgi:two-component system chemotaxis response regulator CheB